MEMNGTTEVKGPCRYILSSSFSVKPEWLLGVRPTTTINLCLVELGMPSLGARVKAAQRKFVLRLLVQREGKMIRSCKFGKCVWRLEPKVRSI